MNIIINVIIIYYILFIIKKFLITIIYVILEKYSTLKMLTKIMKHQKNILKTQPTMKRTKLKIPIPMMIYRMMKIILQRNQELTGKRDLPKPKPKKNLTKSWTKK